MSTDSEVAKLVQDKSKLEIEFSDYKFGAWFAGIMVAFLMLMLGLSIGRSYQNAYYGRRVCTVCRECEPGNPKVYFCPKCAERLKSEQEGGM